jgi:hypothetical protein
MEEGAHGAYATGRAPTSMPESVARTDIVVASLPFQEKKLIRGYYLQWIAPEDLAARLHMKMYKFYSALARSRRMVGTGLESIELYSQLIRPRTVARQQQTRYKAQAGTLSSADM